MAMDIIRDQPRHLSAFVLLQRSLNSSPSSSLQQFELKTKRELNRTTQLLWDSQLPNQTSCQVMNWENWVGC